MEVVAVLAFCIVSGDCDCCPCCSIFFRIYVSAQGVNLIKRIVVLVSWSLLVLLLALCFVRLLFCYLVLLPPVVRAFAYDRLCKRLDCFGFPRQKGGEDGCFKVVC